MTPLCLIIQELQSINFALLPHCLIQASVTMTPPSTVGRTAPVAVRSGTPCQNKICVRIPKWPLFVFPLRSPSPPVTVLPCNVLGPRCCSHKARRCFCFLRLGPRRLPEGRQICSQQLRYIAPFFSSTIYYLFLDTSRCHGYYQH